MLRRTSAYQPLCTTIHHRYTVIVIVLVLVLLLLLPEPPLSLLCPPFMLKVTHANGYTLALASSEMRREQV